MDLVVSKLWIGNLSCAVDVNLLSERGIDRIVTVDIKPLPSSGHLRHYLFIPAHDVSEQDLLTHFQSVFEFVEKGRQDGGGVLVHCYHGVSRSAALVISYLIKKYQTSTKESLARLQSSRPSVLPNDGFMAQLRLYEILLELDPEMESVVARWYRLQKSIPERETSVTDAILDRQSTSKLKCKSCRTILARNCDILHHETGEKADWADLDWVRRVLSGRSGCRLSFFLVPSGWMAMTDPNLEDQGKLLCPKCGAKVGAFGRHRPLKCPCSSTFLPPAFYLTPSRIDFSI